MFPNFFLIIKTTKRSTLKHWNQFCGKRHHLYEIRCTPSQLSIAGVITGHVLFLPWLFLGQWGKIGTLIFTNCAYPWYLLKWAITWNNLKWPTTSKKQPKTTYNEQEMTWNGLQRPTTSKKRPETTWNDLETAYNEQEMTWNNPQWVRQNLQWPDHTYNEQRKDMKQSTTSRFLDYFTIWGNWFSSLTHFQLKT